MDVPARRAVRPVFLYSITLCLSASLLFYIQLIVAKMILPILGGTPAVWMPVGSVLGGVFNAILAPQIFDAVFEYPLAIVFASLVRPALTSL